MAVRGFDPNLRRGQVPGGNPPAPPAPPAPPVNQRRAPANRAQEGQHPPVQPPPQREGKGIFGDFLDMVAKVISEIHDLIFSCFAEKKKMTEQQQARDGTLPIIVERWFSRYPKLGKHLKAEDLIEDLNKLPAPVFQAVDFAFFNGRPLNAPIDTFVRDYVMQVDPAREIKDDKVIESLKKLSPEEFSAVCAEYFAGQANPGRPLSVEAFVRGYVMRQRFGERLHAGHLIEDLMGLPREILEEVYSSFFQGQASPPKIKELSVGEFVNDHIRLIPGAMARLEVALRLQMH